MSDGFTRGCRDQQWIENLNLIKVRRPLNSTFPRFYWNGNEIMYVESAVLTYVVGKRILNILDY